MTVIGVDDLLDTAMVGAFGAVVTAETGNRGVFVGDSAGLQCRVHALEHAAFAECAYVS